MTGKYDFGNLAPIEFEALAVDLVSATTGFLFESFCEGPDEGMDGRHSTAAGNIILQAKHYKNSTWSGLKTATKNEKNNIQTLQPIQYYFVTSQNLTSKRKKEIKEILSHESVKTKNIWGRTEINAQLQKHSDVEKRNIKLWLSSTAVLERVLKNNIAVFTEATQDEIERILKVFVMNPSVDEASKRLNSGHCLIVSGPPGVGKTTLAQVLATQYFDAGWELIALSSIEDGLSALNSESKQIFVFDDFLGKIKLDLNSLASNEHRISRFMKLVAKRKNKRFILTTRSYIFQTARENSEALDEPHIDFSEMVLDLSVYTREIKARILYNHLYHSDIDQNAVQELLKGNTIQHIIDHRNYMPRIIQWMTDHLRVVGITPVDYPKRFLDALENPHKVWEKAFCNHISANAQVLLFCLYFSETKRFPNPGISTDGLETFFTSATDVFEVQQEVSIATDTYEKTLREIKSSFITIELNRINFINPSVQDYLSRTLENKNTLSKLATAATNFHTVESIWKTARSNFSKDSDALDEISTALLLSFQKIKKLETQRLDRVINLLGELMLSSTANSFHEFLRAGALKPAIWIDECRLPKIIGYLSSGKFSTLPYAQVYSRFLRQQLSKFLFEDADRIELDELARLSDSFCISTYEFSQTLINKFEELSNDEIEKLDIDSIENDGMLEIDIDNLIQNIEKIENLVDTHSGTLRIIELEQHLSEQQMQAENEEEQYFRENPNKNDTRKTNAGEETKLGSSKLQQLRGKEYFSNQKLDAMFSSLKKNDP